MPDEKKKKKKSLKKEKIVEIKKSKTNTKKYAAVVRGPNGKERIVNFGAKGYEQYKDSTPLKTYSKKDHLDKERRKKYFLRHSGVDGKRKALEREWKKSKGLYTPKILSHQYLW